jgi:hypothetical protein
MPILGKLLSGWDEIMALIAQAGSFPKAVKQRMSSSRPAFIPGRLFKRLWTASKLDAAVICVSGNKIALFEKESSEISIILQITDNHVHYPMILNYAVDIFSLS